MLVKYWMRTPVATIDINDSAQEAVVRMREHYQTLLPVVRNGRLVGTVSDENLKKASVADAAALDIHELAYAVSKITVDKIMTQDPVTSPPDYTLIEVAALLLLSKVWEAPVVDSGGRVLGLISQQDVLWALMTLGGYESRGMELAVRVEDRPGSIKEITDIVRSYDGRLASLLTSFARAPAGYRHLYLRTYGIDRRNLKDLLDQVSKKGTLLYRIDHRENHREEFGGSDDSPAAVPPRKED
ncbi:MAG: CBS domain-containing protein [Desulfomonile tiedjei]|nr:CBS domain-containing protein [Desulfomonile tiedjei]